MKNNILSCLLGFVLSACSYSSMYHYPYNSEFSSYPNVQKVQKKSIKVQTFEDLREHKNYDKYMMFLIPLMPYGWATINRPEFVYPRKVTVDSFKMNVKKDLKKSTELSLKESNLFKVVTKSKNADYLLKSEIKKLQYNGKVFTYGASMYGSLLWVLGFPKGTSENIIEMKYELVDSKTEDVLFSKEYSGDYSVINSYYYNAGNDTDYFAKIYQDIMNEFIQDYHEEFLD